MTDALIPARRASVVRLSGLLDARPERAFDRYTEFACKLLSAPVSVASLKDGGKQFVKSCKGAPGTWLRGDGAELMSAVCRHVAAAGEPLAISSVQSAGIAGTTLERLRAEGFAALLGAPLTNPDGTSAGALCVFDFEPREWSAEDIETARDLAEGISSEIALRLYTRDIEEREQNLRTALRAGEIGLWSIDFTTMTDQRSAEMNRILGLPAVETSQHVKDFFSRIHPDDRKRAIAKWRTTGSDGGAYESENRVVRPDGEVRWLRDVGRLVADPDGQPLYATGAAVDITEQKEAEERARQNALFLRRLLDSLFAFAGVCTRDGILIEANRAALASANLEPADVLGKPFVESYWFAHDPAVQRQVAEAVERARDGQGSRFDIAVRLAESRFTTIDFQIMPMRNERGEVTHLVPSGIDISGRKRTENELKRLTRILDATPDLVGIADPGTLAPIYINQGGCELLGYESAGEALGRPVESFHPPWAFELIRDVAAPAAIAEGSWSGETALMTKSGREIPVSQVVLAHKAADGAVEYLSTIARDISDRKQAEEILRQNEKRLEKRVAERTAALTEANRLLELRNRELQEFAYVASHDLQEPLRKITAFGGRLRDTHAERLDERGQDYLRRMLDAAERMMRLIQELLEFSRVRTRAKPFELLDLGGIVQNALADLEIAVAENGADIEVGGLPSIEGDASQIERLFQNLLANAIKFRRPEEPPRIAVRARILDEHESMPGPVCRIEVSDNGIGFDVKYLDRIFTPFQRLHGRSEYEGVGMGLAICRRIVERHRGLISAESVQGQGSTFIVTLSVKQPVPPRAGRGEDT